MSGAHYDYIDFSINIYLEAGTPESGRNIRTWMKHLSEFVHSLDLARARPLRGIVQSQPQHTCECTFGVENEDFCIYLADQREIGEPDAGKPIAGRVTALVPKGSYRVACYSPVTGVYSPAVTLSSAGALDLEVPSFVHDIAIRITKA